jgi:hypothetical protein
MGGRNIPPLEGEGDQPQAGGGVSGLEPKSPTLTPLRRADARHLPSKGRISHA